MASEKRIYRVTFEVQVGVEAPDEKTARLLAQVELLDGMWEAAFVTDVCDKGPSDAD